MMTILLAGIGGFVASLVLVCTLFYYTEIRHRKKYTAMEVAPQKMKMAEEGKPGKKYKTKVDSVLDEQYWNKQLEAEEAEKKRFQFQDERKDSLGSIGF